MQLGQRIKELRKKKSLTQNELARLANMSRSYLADVENNRYNPSLSTLENIADVLGVPLDRLTGESASSIIDDKLEEKRMTLEDLAKQANVSLHWLQNLDTFIPGQLGGNEIGYKWITQVAKVLGLPGGKLRSALARQEVPAYDGPISSVEEDFGDVNFIKEDSAKYKTDRPETTNPDIRMIARAGLSNEESAQLRKVAEALFPNAFKKDSE